MGQTNIFTFTLTNDVLVISKAQNAVSISVLVKSGSIDFLGNLSFDGIASTSVTWRYGRLLIVICLSNLLGRLPQHGQTTRRPPA